MNLKQTFLSAIIISITLISCQEDKPIEERVTDLTYVPMDNLSFIKPPFLERDIEQEVFEIDAQKDEEIISESGSKLKIYKNTIVGADGKVVKGKVKIEYRDFHNPLDVYLSGIPMEYDSAGTKYIFETAGMFELKAYQNEKQLKLKSGDKIEVELVSTSNEPEFNFYNFDESTGVWTNENQPMQITTVAKNEPKTELKEKLDTKGLIKPFVQNIKNYAFDVDVNKKQYPELEAYEGTIFEVKNEDSFNPIYYNIQWDKVAIDRKKRNHYVLELFKEDTSIVVDVKPVIKSEKYHQAIAKYNKQKKQREEDKKERSDFDVYATPTISFNSSTSTQYEIKRHFQVNGFGIFNVDQPKVNPQGTIESIFVNENDQKKKIANASYYLVNLEQNSLVSLYSSPKYFKARENILWSVIDGNKMIIASPEQIATMSNKTLYLESYSIKEGLEVLSEVIALK